MQMNTCLWDWCYQKNMGGFDHGSVCILTNKWGSPVSKGEKEHSSWVSRAHWESSKLYLKEDRDIARAWYGEDYGDHPRTERRLKRGYLDQAQAAEDITTRQEYPCATLLGYWHKQILLWNFCTPARVIWGTTMN